MVRAGTVPTYDRSPTPTIAHLGVGAFARAHLGIYADDLCRNGWPALIRGVSIKSPRAENQLSAQDGLYTVAEREPDADIPLRVVGSITSALTGPSAAVDALAAPTTTLVTLTITEKGYEPADTSPPTQPATSALAIIASALARRRDAKLPGLVIASLDNLMHNGDVLSRAVLTHAEHLDPSLPRWVTDHVAFPSSVVDRMVPASTEEDLRQITSRLGLVDLAAVTTERHRTWAITATDGLPPLSDVGVEVVADIANFERRKLWLLNGPHSALAYCGLLAGYRTIAEAATHPPTAKFVQRLIDDILAVADLPDTMRPARFAAEALHRFSNPSLDHTCVQVATDGSRKLPQRLLPVVTARADRGLDTTRLAIVVAAWIAAAAQIRIQGATLPDISDPLSAPIQSAARRGDLADVCQVALPKQTSRQLLAQVQTALAHLVSNGPTALEARHP